MSVEGEDVGQVAVRVGQPRTIWSSTPTLTRRAGRGRTWGTGCTASFRDIDARVRPEAPSMKFGLFLELSVSQPATREAEARVFRQSIEDAVLGDQLGFDHVWVVEHHFLEEYSHSGAPEVLLGAIAAKTQRIRLGHGVVVCVPQINHPVRVAERIAVLDIISDGR